MRMASKRRAERIPRLFFALCLCVARLEAQDASVFVRVQVQHAESQRGSEIDRPGAARSKNSAAGLKPGAVGSANSAAGSGKVVAWLTSSSGPTAPPAPRPRQGYQLVQKDKQFVPHLLVVPTGSSVDFPNLDPFFHNVFSLFNGKRFDLGLYEAGSRRAVRFDREGVSYIFCNIHPEMGAIVVSLSTPYYAVSTDDGVAVLHDVPPGTYRLHLWAEDVPAGELQSAERQLKVEGAPLQVGEIRLLASAQTPEGHKNKFGEEYKPRPTDPY